MGAPAALATWIPEDDFRLKNAVENGASLESLAKGAVCFSRRFTIQELQDRWRSLLYDLDTSSEASARMIEVESEISGSDPMKPIRAYSFKGKDSSYGKRKGDSVRSHYYAIRKRVCNEPHGPSDLSFLMPNGSHGIHTYGGYGDQSKPPNDHPCTDFAPGAPTSDHYGHFEVGSDCGPHVFPDQLRVASADARCDFSQHAYQANHVQSGEDELPDGMMSKDDFYVFTGNTSVDNTGGTNVAQSFGHSYTEEAIPLITGENHVSFQRYSSGQEIDLPQEFDRPVLYRNDNIEAKPLSGIDSINDNHEHLCSDFIGQNNLTSQAEECNDSLQQLGYSSAPPVLPIWTSNGISAPTIPRCAPYEEQDVFNIDDTQKLDLPGCVGNASETRLDDGMSSPGLLEQGVLSEEDLINITASYMDFADDDDDFLGIMDEKGITTRSCLNDISNILLSSLSGEHQDDTPNLSSHTSPNILDTCLTIPDVLCSGETYDLSDQVHPVNDEDNVSIPEMNLPPTVSGTYQTAEPLEEFMICTLNTEDQDIPCNDIVYTPSEVLPQVPTSGLGQSSEEKVVSVSSAMVSSNDQNANIQDLRPVNEEESVTHPVNSSPKAEASILPKKGLVPSPDACKEESESFRSSCIVEVPGHTGIAIGNCLPCIPASVPLQSSEVAAVKDTSKSSDTANNGYFNNSVSAILENSVQGQEVTDPFSVKMINDCEQEVFIPVTLQMDVPSHLEIVPVVTRSPDLVVNVLTSDQEDHSSDNENDVPNFYGIESMILDMDLDPHDEESCLFATEVARYQSADARKAIIRLEQCARSSMNRAISCRGGFAILYGRHLKYFMKEHEVSLGRGTDELEVDIDLSKEGPANKISRLQAFIKLDEDGLFSLRNVGKCSVFINGKEIPSKKRTNLTSGSLIEIKELRFIFEINQNAVLQHITKLRGGSAEKNTQFDWVPGLK